VKAQTADRRSTVNQHLDTQRPQQVTRYRILCRRVVVAWSKHLKRVRLCCEPATKRLSLCEVAAMREVAAVDEDVTVGDV